MVEAKKYPRKTFERANKKVKMQYAFAAANLQSRY